MEPNSPQEPQSKPDVIQKLRYTHQAMADAILLDPSISQNKLSAMFGYSVGWVSQVLNTDGFQAYLETRKKELTDPLLTATVEERLRGLLTLSVNVMADKLAMPNPDADLAVKAAELSARALGYGARKDQVTHTHYVVALPDKSGSSREWAQRVQPAVIDVSAA